MVDNKIFKSGFDLMTEEQRVEWQNLEERRAHSGTMRFTGIDAVHLNEYRELAKRLEYIKRMDYIN